MTTDTLEKTGMNDVQQPFMATDTSALLASPLYPSALHGMLQGALSTLAPVVIAGERGTRKRALIRAIHQEGTGRGRPLFFVRAKRFPEETADILRQGKEGMEGTVILAGIEHLLGPMQEVLHDYLDTGQLALGGIRRSVSLRIIILSEMRLFALADLPELDRSLLHRLCIIPLDLPPLRERQADIPRIAAFFVERFSNKYRMTSKEFSLEAQKSLMDYRWPENLDELEGVVGRSLAASGSAQIMPRDLSFLPGAPRMTPGLADGHAFGGIAETLQDAAGTPPRPGQAASDAGQSLAMRLAHEIKNPLVSIQTYANLLEEKFGDDEFRREFYQVMKRDVEKIDHVVEELLAASREGGEGVEEEDRERSMERVRVDINALAEEAIAGSLDELAQRRIAVFRDLGGDIPMVLLSKHRVSTALAAIVVLVSRNTGAGGDLRISTTRTAFQGRDNGDGHFVQVAVEGTSSQADMAHLRRDLASAERALASLGAHMELKESAGGGVAVVVTLPLAPAVAGLEER